jgi:DNA-binding NarL/FixJ family response regulator
MTCLLVHSNNTSLLEIEEFQNNNILFSLPTEKDVDHYISELITEQIEDYQPDVLFIKYALGNDYLAFFGLRFAHHIRLYNTSNNLPNIPIVFVGEESVAEIIRLSDYSDILATTGIYYVNEDLYRVRALLDRIYEHGLKGIKTQDHYLNRVNIPAPLNYDSQHNYINEVSLFLWSEYIGCTQFNKDIQTRIEHSLYFKYRNKKDELKREKKNKFKLESFEIQSNVLLIDDESAKGWDKFYYHLFSSSNELIKFNKVDFNKSDTKDNIIDHCINQIEEFSPDIILLDLRLSEKDALEADIKSLTGYSLLEKIKSINKGIQVVVISASNKTTTYKEVIELGADYYVIKNEKADEAYEYLIKALKSAMKEAIYLKPISSRIREAINILKDKQIPKKAIEVRDLYGQLKHSQTNNEILKFLNAAFETISNGKIEERYTIGVLQIYRVIELVCEYYIEESKNGHKYNYAFDDNKILKHYEYNRGSYNSITHNGSKMSRMNQAYNVFHQFSNKIDNQLFQNLHNLKEYRNNSIHPDERFKTKTLESLFEQNFNRFQKDIVNYFSCVCEYLIGIAESNH